MYVFVLDVLNADRLLANICKSAEMLESSHRPPPVCTPRHSSGMQQLAGSISREGVRGHPACDYFIFARNTKPKYEAHTS